LGTPLRMKSERCSTLQLRRLKCRSRLGYGPR
jgi:hypothetical protein